MNILVKQNKKFNFVGLKKPLTFDKLYLELTLQVVNISANMFIWKGHAL